MSARGDVERIAAEHRAATDRFIGRIVAIERAGRDRAMQVRAPHATSRPGPVGRPHARQVTGARPDAQNMAARDELESDGEPRAGWLI